MSVLNRNWKNLIKPSKIKNDGDEEKKHYMANLVIEPLERGYGLTLGNALRRILISSLQGAAITSVKIPGVEHEFATKAGIKEDIVDVILNVKQICLKMHSTEKKTLRIKAKGPCVVTAGMIEVGAGVEIMNPNQLICTVSKGEEFEMEMQCEVGKGYNPAAGRKKDQAIGNIAVDALFSPVKKVSYKVEDTRVGQMTDYDKLTMHIETDSSMTPETALALAARILQDQLQLFINFKDEEDEKPTTEEKLEYNPNLLKKVEDLELTVRSRNCLQNDNIVYIGDLVVKTEAQMLTTPNFGRKSLNEIKDVLTEMNLKFGMEVPNWPPENIEELAKKHEDPY